MIIAVAYADGQIFQHFGHTQAFKLYEIENDTVLTARIVETNGSGHGTLAGFLTGQGVDVLICGGIGGCARLALAEAGIRLFGGVSGDADDAVEALLSGQLMYNPNVRCNHHEHNGGHICGNHSCEA